MINTKVNLLKGNILKSLIVFAIPLFISNLFQQLYNTVDIMIVGNYLGDTSLAAIGASTAVYDLLVGFALGIGNGLSIVCCRFNYYRNFYYYNNYGYIKSSFNAIITNVKYTSKYNRRIIFLYINDYLICWGYVCI